MTKADTAVLLETCGEIVAKRQILGFWDVCRAYVTLSEEKAERKSVSLKARAFELNRATLKNWRAEGSRKKWLARMRRLLDGPKTTTEEAPPQLNQTLLEDIQWMADVLYDLFEAPKETAGGREPGLRMQAKFVREMARMTPNKGHLERTSHMFMKRHKADIERRIQDARDQGRPAKPLNLKPLRKQRQADFQLHDPKGENPF